MSSKASRRAKNDRRARAALAWGLVLFVCVQAGVRVLMQADPELGEREFGRKLTYLRALLAENPGRPLILTLGSSRMATGFRPAAIPPLPAVGGVTPVAFNFAMVGTGPEMSQLVLHRLLAAGIRPAWVLIEYWPPFWTTERTWKDFRSQINIGRLDLEAVRLVGGYLRRPRQPLRTWVEAQVAPVYAYRSALLSKYAPAWVEGAVASTFTVTNLDRSGWWSPHDKRTSESDRTLLARLLGHYSPILAKFQTRAIPDHALHATLEVCLREKIHATVLFLPEGDAFRKCYPPATLAKVDAYLDRLQRERGVPVIDARTWVADAGFLDGHHLLPEGAAQFTARLGRTVIVPEVAELVDAPRHSVPLRR